MKKLFRIMTVVIFFLSSHAALAAYKIECVSENNLDLAQNRINENLEELAKTAVIHNVSSPSLTIDSKYTFPAKICVTIQYIPKK